MTPETAVFLNDYGGWIVAGLALAAAAYASIRTIFCKGKSDEHEKNRVNLLEERLDKLDSDFELLKGDIQDYRTKTEHRLDEIRDNQAYMKTDIEVTKNNISFITKDIKYIKDVLTKLVNR